MVTGAILIDNFVDIEIPRCPYRTPSTSASSHIYVAREVGAKHGVEEQGAGFEYTTTHVAVNVEMVRMENDILPPGSA